MKRTAVIFDLDGTLVDSLEDLADASNAVLTRFGFPSHPTEAYRYFVGDGVEALVRRALPPRERGGAREPRVLEAVREEYARRYAAKTRPYAGIPELLTRLGQRGARLAILSNKPHDATQQVVKRLLSRWTFQPVLGARAGVPKKPHPAGALEIAAELRLDPERFLYLGDTGVDMETARAAGMLPVGVLWGFREEEELRRAGAGVVVSEPQEVLTLLDGR